MELRKARRVAQVWAAVLALLVAAMGSGIAQGEGEQEFADQQECMDATQRMCHETDFGTFYPDPDPRSGGTYFFDLEYMGHSSEVMSPYLRGTHEHPVVAVDFDQVVFPDVQPVLDPTVGRVRVPIRFISEKMGAQVTWVQATKTVNIERPELRITLQVDNPTMQVNGEDRPLDAPPILVDDRVLVPLRAISEMFGAKVDWVGDTPPAVDPTYTGKYQVWIWIPWGYWGSAGLDARLTTGFYQHPTQKP